MFKTIEILLEEIENFILKKRFSLNVNKKNLLVSFIVHIENKYDFPLMIELKKIDEF